MKYKVRNIIAYMMLIYTMFLSAAFAAEIYAQPTSTAEIEIIPGNGPTFPVNPENPKEDLPGGGEVYGDLAIVNVTQFRFGTIKVSEKKGMHDLDPEVEQPHIQVVDLRGTEAGWSVSASVTQFESEGKHSLKSSVIHISDGRPKSLVSDLYAPHHIKDVELTTDGETIKVISAPSGMGMGLWVMRWYPENENGSYIKLEIPAGAATKGTHKATINWILNNGP